MPKTSFLLALFLCALIALSVEGRSRGSRRHSDENSESREHVRHRGHSGGSRFRGRSVLRAIGDVVSSILGSNKQEELERTILVEHLTHPGPVAAAPVYPYNGYSQYG